MSEAYLFRLVCLIFASIFVVHLAIAAIVGIASGLMVRIARRLSTRGAARFLFAMRLLPVSAALFSAVCLCAPSYLWLEPKGIEEPVGLLCLVFALLGLGLLGYSLEKGIRMLVRSARFSSVCGRSGYEMPAPGIGAPALVISGSKTLLALTGILRPRIVISERIVESLSAEELSVVMQHEEAHRSSRDNMKRLWVAMAPELPGLGRLERYWTRFSEYAADEDAVAGDSRRALALASALVCVARSGLADAPALATSFVGDSADLNERVSRLLALSEARERSAPPSRSGISGALVLSALALAAMLQPSTFQVVRTILERLIQ